MKRPSLFLSFSSFSLILAVMTVLGGCAASTEEAGPETTSAADSVAPDDLFALPNSFCNDAPLTKDDAIALAGPVDGPGRKIGEFPVYQRERRCSDASCEAWGPASAVPGPYGTFLRAYTEFGPTTEVVLEVNTSEVSVECDRIGKGCQSEGRSITGTVAAHCFWLLQEAPSTHGQIQWVTTGRF
jgi:hypothetical protein